MAEKRTRFRLPPGSPSDGAQPQSPLETYLREIIETKLLTAEDDQILARND
ncbi:MAG: sigma-70 factor domain-containing protein [Pirellula sp.]